MINFSIYAYLKYILFALLIIGTIGCKSKTASEVGATGDWRNSKGQKIADVKDEAITLTASAINDIVNSPEAKEFMSVSSDVDVFIYKNDLKESLQNLKPPKFYQTASYLDPFMWLFFPILSNYYYATRDADEHFAMSKYIFMDDFNTHNWQQNACKGISQEAVYVAMYVSFSYSTANKKSAELQVSFHASREQYSKKAGTSFPIPLEECTLSMIRDSYETTAMIKRYSKYYGVSLSRS